MSDKNLTMVTNTSAGSIRVGSAVVSPGQSTEVDTKSLDALRDKKASKAAQAHGEALEDGVPTVKKMTKKEEKAESSKIVKDAKAEATEIVNAAKAEAAEIEKSMEANKDALAAIGK